MVTAAVSVLDAISAPAQETTHSTVFLNNEFLKEHKLAECENFQSGFLGPRVYYSLIEAGKLKLVNTSTRVPRECLVPSFKGKLEHIFLHKDQLYLSTQDELIQYKVEFSTFTVQLVAVAMHNQDQVITADLFADGNTLVASHFPKKLKIVAERTSFLCRNQTKRLVVEDHKSFFDKINPLAGGPKHQI